MPDLRSNPYLRLGKLSISVNPFSSGELLATFAEELGCMGDRVEAGA